MSTILSGIQPTGNLHFGRYFGAVQNWKKLQQEHDCLYMVVDYHAMTMPFSPLKLKQNVWELIYNLLAAGIEPENLFIQSLIPEHVELGWILNCFASYGQLGRMTQFKDKSAQSAEKSKDDFISVGLFTYPVLQAADILIYHATKVPVGKDQDQHLELTRTIAQSFNHKINKEYFTPPEALYTQVPKVMSTADPMRKMSASLGEKHNIDLFAEPDRIRKQIRSAVTATAVDGTMSPGVENLFSLLRAAGQKEAHDSLMEDFKSQSLKYVDLKHTVAEALVAISEPIRERKAAIKADKKAVKSQVKASSEIIRKRAQKTVKEVKELVGLTNIRF